MVLTQPVAGGGPQFHFSSASTFMQSQQRHANVHMNKPQVLTDAGGVMLENVYVLDVLYVSHTGMLWKPAHTPSPLFTAVELHCGHCLCLHHCLLQ